MRTSETIDELAEALSQAQAEITNPEKNAKNPHYKSNYADLAGVLATVRPAFSKVGLAVIQMPHTTESGNIALTTRIVHKSGQWVEDSLDIPMQGSNIAQAAGTVITYLRRYSLAAAAGVHQEDPDAQGLDGETTKLRDGADAIDEETVKGFANRMLQALNEDNPEYIVGRACIDQKDVWSLAHNGTRNKKNGYFSSKDKTTFGELSDKYLSIMTDYATQLDDATSSDDADQIRALLEELGDNHTDKGVVWHKVNNQTKQAIKALNS